MAYGCYEERTRKLSFLFISLPPVFMITLFLSPLSCHNDHWRMERVIISRITCTRLSVHSFHPSASLPSFHSFVNKGERPFHLTQKKGMLSPRMSTFSSFPAIFLWSEITWHSYPVFSKRSFQREIETPFFSSLESSSTDIRSFGCHLQQPPKKIHPIREKKLCDRHTNAQIVVCHFCFLCLSIDRTHSISGCLKAKLVPPFLIFPSLYCMQFRKVSMTISREERNLFPSLYLLSCIESSLEQRGMISPSVTAWLSRWI